MVALADRRVIAAVTVGALVLACIGAGAVLLRPAARPVDPSLAGRGALQVRQNATEAKSETAAALRCFADGRFVGMMTIAACAQRNGVSSQGLDVGLANTTAASAPAPAPAEPSSRPSASESATSDGGVDAAVDRESATPCLRFASGSWRAVGGGRMPLGACAHALYQGRCVGEGEALYGRFGALSLRLVPGRVESSDDNRHFSTLVVQNDDCTLDE